jgi:hypothetical protein
VTSPPPPPRARALLLSLWIVLAPVAIPAQSLDTFTYPLRLSADRTFLVDQRNRPFFINGDAAWSLVAQASPAEAAVYLADRARKGYNLVLVNLLEHAFADNAPANRAGESPFTRPGDFAAPNEAYFAHADSVIRKAAELGLAVLLDPLYLGYQCGGEGWCAEVKASSLAAMRSYGRFVGSRYRHFANLIWLIGGDADPAANGVERQVREVVSGIRESDPTHLFTAHNAPEQSALDVWGADTWVDLNSLYTYGRTYVAARQQIVRHGSRPLFLLESSYENEHGSTPVSLRRQAYWSVLSGGVCGHVFGNCPLWSFGAPAAKDFCAVRQWQSQLDSPGSTTLAYVGRLFSSRAFFALVPDLTHAVLTAGDGSGDALATAARARDGSSAIVYMPTPRSITVNLSTFPAGSVRAWWFNPATAVATLIALYPAAGRAEFTPPGPGDWVLVLDEASRDLPAPGQYPGF